MSSNWWIGKATTVRFTDEVFARLDQASARTGLPVNSIVVAACLEWLALHVERSATPPAPRWATLRRAVEQAFHKGTATVYPFERFTAHAKKFLTLAQGEAQKRGHNYIGTEHLLLACFADSEFRSAKVLTKLGLHRETVEASLDSMLVGETPVPPREEIHPTARVKKVIEIAFQLVAESGDGQVGTDHVLWALSKEGNGLAAIVLNNFGATLPRIETEIASLKDSES